MATVGCTTPFGKNKSNICLNPEQGRRAEKLFWEVTNLDITEADKRCQISCEKILTTFGRVSEIESTEVKRGLKLNFDNLFIHRYTSHLAYGWLEFLAEVGGYFGLFLGVSINQILSLCKKLLITLRYYYT